jgi:hypothetical protein
MNHHQQGLTKETIVDALGLLNGSLKAADTYGEICLFGGTAMVLAFNARLSTKDVDAIFKPPQIFREAAIEIARAMGLPEDWLNDGVKGFVSASPAHTEDDLPQMSNLRVIRPTAEYLLAMKCMAARSPSYDTKGDRDDIAFLVLRLGLRDADEVLRTVEQFYPQSQIPPKTHFMVLEVMENIAKEPPKIPSDVTHVAKHPANLRSETEEQDDGSR